MPFALDLTNPLKQYYDEGSNIQTLLWVYYGYLVLCATSRDISVTYMKILEGNNVFVCWATVYHIKTVVDMCARIQIYGLKKSVLYVKTESTICLIWKIIFISGVKCDNYSIRDRT